MDIPDWVPEALARLTRETGERLLDVADEIDAEVEPQPRI
ncbi:protein of unassigned function [Methylobacterium oryzae CBMB20]|nr:protein of unassigned function [Methylobacterium oryzae CBMB20]